MKKYEIYTTETEPYSPWQNNAERENKIVKKLGRYFMQSTDTPIFLWPLAYTFAAEIRSRLLQINQECKEEHHSRILMIMPQIFQNIHHFHGTSGSGFGNLLWCSLNNWVNGVG